MAPNRSNPKDYPPSASSGSSSEEATSDEEQGSGEVRQKPLFSPHQGKPHNGKSKEEEEEEQDNDESSDGEDSPPPVRSSKPSPVTAAKNSMRSDSVSDVVGRKPSGKGKENVKSVSSEPEAKGDAELVSNASKKKATEALEGHRMKKSKQKSEEMKEDTKQKYPFARLWTDEDEIVLLEGAINFGGDPTKDVGSFRDFISKDLHFNVSVPQLKEKFFRMKRKFVKNKNTNKVSNKDHDQKVFELSKKIWGHGGASPNASTPPVAATPLTSIKPNNGTVSAIKSRKATSPLPANKPIGNLKPDETHSSESEFRKLDFRRDSALDEYVLSKAMELMDSSSRKKMNDRLQELHKEELKLFLRRQEVVTECTNLVLASYEE